MIRPILTQMVLFAAPFAAYALFLWVTRGAVLDRKSWGASILIWLTIVGFIIMIAAFLLLAEFSGSPPGSTYVPAHMEDGQLVPGTLQ